MTKSLIEDFASIKLGLDQIEKAKAAERARPEPSPATEAADEDDKFDWSSVLAQGLSDIYGC